MSFHSLKDINDIEENAVDLSSIYGIKFGKEPFQECL